MEIIIIATNTIIITIITVFMITIITIISIIDITTRNKHRGQAGVMFLGGDQVELIGELLQDTRNTKHLKFYVKRGF